jgi:hypothetical protein
MNGSVSTEKSYEARSTRDSIKLVVWIFTWMASLTISDKAALYGWWEGEWITILSILVTATLGLGVLLAFRNMLGRMDDLQRKIQLDALAVALGISLVGCAVYSLLVTWGYILDEEVTDIFVLMCISYSAVVLFSVVKYQ